MSYDSPFVVVPPPNDGRPSYHITERWRDSLYYPHLTYPSLQAVFLNALVLDTRWVCRLQRYDRGLFVRSCLQRLGFVILLTVSNPSHPEVDRRVDMEMPGITLLSFNGRLLTGRPLKSTGLR